MSDEGNSSSDNTDLFGFESIEAMKAAILPARVFDSQVKLIVVSLLCYFAVAIFPITAAFCLYLSYQADIHSYWNLLFLELSTGFFFFAATPIVIHLGRKHRLKVPLGGAILTAALLYIAYECEKLLPGFSPHAREFLQAAFIEYSITLLLIVGLELVMAPWLNALREKHHNATERRDDLEDESEGRKFPGHGPF